MKRSIRHSACSLLLAATCFASSALQTVRADHDYTRSDFEREIARLTEGRGVDYVLDSLGSPDGPGRPFRPDHRGDGARGE